MRLLPCALCSLVVLGVIPPTRAWLGWFRPIARAVEIFAHFTRLDSFLVPHRHEHFAVCRGGIGGGHYNALCRNADDGNWYQYNDSVVSKAALADLDPGEPYILFYQLRDR